MTMRVPAPEPGATPETELNVSALENDVCQALADYLRFHLKVPNGELVINTKNGEFSYVRLTIGHKPQVRYAETLLPSPS